jgi:hypothetical protein
MVAIGTKGVGKTYQTRKEITYAVMVNKRKVLIYDASLDPELSKYKTLDPKDIGLFNKSKKPEIRRIVALDKYGKELNMEQKRDLLNTILNTFRGGILVLEDFSKYIVQTNQNIEVISAITTNRHRNLDIILHYQSLRALDTRMFQNVRCVRMHKDLESPDTFRTRLSDKYELFKIASLIVDAAYRNGTDEGKRFFLYILTDDFKIIGASQEQFENACKKYLYGNRAMFKQLKDENDLATDEQALAFFIEDRTNLYLSV